MRRLCSPVPSYSPRSRSVTACNRAKPDIPAGAAFLKRSLATPAVHVSINHAAVTLRQRAASQSMFSPDCAANGRASPGLGVPQNQKQ
jgi:hypothetical protein